MRFLWFSVLVLLPLSCFGQDAPEQPSSTLGANALSTFRPPQPQPLVSGAGIVAVSLTAGNPGPVAVHPVQPVITKSAPERSAENGADHKRLWLALTAAQHGSAVFDAWSTRAALESGRGYERDPLLTPFAGSNAIYPALQVLPLGLDYVSRRMMNSSHPWLRKTWWVPQSISTAGFLWSGSRNLRVAQLR
jgi:hypothetical protein